MESTTKACPVDSILQQFSKTVDNRTNIFYYLINKKIFTMKIMKILLIYPYCLEERLTDEDVKVPPIGVFYVGAMLKENGYDVEILNWYNINKQPEVISQTLQEKKPDIIGFSVLHANRWGAIEIAQTAKRINPGVKIVFGGIGPTFLWEHFLGYFKEIDYCVLGEGEYAFLNLVKYIEKKDENSLMNLKGIAFRQGDAIQRTERDVPIEPLDKLPNPAKYFTYQHVTATRGCPGKCTFCGSPQFWGQRVRFHSAEYFVHQLELLYNKGVRFFYFSDDTFMIKKDRVIEICKKILEKRLPITWAAISRVDLVNEEILYWMRKAGCTQISYGVESGSEKIRNLLNKNIKREQIKKAFNLTTGYGILPRAYFIYGSPGEDWATIQDTLNLMAEIKPLSAIFYILDLFPGTALYRDYQKRTGLSDDIWMQQIEDIMYFETDPRLSKEQILAFGTKLRTEFHQMLPDFVDSIELISKEDLSLYHADFLSRLGMTFSHGDYAGVEEIQNKQEIAEKLYRKSLSYSPNERAYLGLGIILQQKRAFQESLQILAEGVGHFPQNVQLHICSGISHMNLGDFSNALICFSRVEPSGTVQSYMEECRRQMR